MDIRKIADGLATQTKMAARDTLVYTRAATEKTADLVGETRKPVDTLTDAGLELNRITYKGVESMLKYNHDALVGLVDSGAKRLRTAANARSFKALVDGQIALFPATRERVVADFNRVVAIYAEAGQQTLGVLRGTGESLGLVKPVAKKPKAAKATKKTAKKTAKKASKKVTGASKKAGSSVRKASRKAATEKTAGKPAGKTGA